MEGTQESSTSTQSTKSSRKRLRKKQVAALKKFILASEAAISCKIEPEQASKPESVEIKGCLSNIVFHNNSVREKDILVENNSSQNNVTTKTKSVCCEASSDVLIEKNQDTKGESTAPHSKRRRSKKKALNTEVSSDKLVVTLDPTGQKTFETPSTEHLDVPRKENLEKEKSLFGPSTIQAPFSAKNKDLKRVDQTKPSDNKSDFKAQAETGDKESTLSRSKRKRNRKKALVSSENVDVASQIVNDKQEIKSQKTPECPPQVIAEQLYPLKDHTSVQRLYLDPSTSISSEIPASDKKSQFEKNKSSPKSVETAVGKGGKHTAKVEGKSQASALPEKLSDICKKTCDPKAIHSLVGKSIGAKVKEGDAQRDLSNPEEKETPCVGLELDVAKCLEVVGKSENCRSACEKEHSLSSLAFQKTSASSKISMSAEDNPASVDRVWKNESRGGQVSKESSSQEKGKLLTKSVSKCNPDVKKDMPVHYDEVDRSSAGISTIIVETKPGGMNSSMPKIGDSSKEVNVVKTLVSKGVPHPKKVDPVHTAICAQSEVCVDRVRMGPKPEEHKKDDHLPESSDRTESIPENVSEVKVVPTSVKFISKGAVRARKGDLIPRVLSDKSESSPSSVMVEDKLESSKEDGQGSVPCPDAADKSKEKIKAEREARKAAKLAKKHKDNTSSDSTGTTETPAAQSSAPYKQHSEDDEVKLIEAKTKVMPPPPSQEGEKVSAEKSKAELRAERRAKQEAQRAAKAAATSNKAAPVTGKVKSSEETKPKAVPLARNKAEPKRPLTPKVPKKEQGVKLLSVLGWGDGRLKRSTSEDLTLKDTQAVHPAIVQLCTKFTDRVISGSNARCLGFVQAIKKAILDYQTPPQKELGRDMEACLLTPSLAFLESQRPLAVSILNATKFLKWQLTQLQPLEHCSSEISSVATSENKKVTVKSDEEAKLSLIDGLDSYIWEKIEVAQQAVCSTLRDKITDGDVILTYGCSYLLLQILAGAKKAGTKFKVVVVDGRPWKEGREMLRRLVAIGIPCSYMLVSAASSVMRQVSKVLLGAHALLSNGYVMSRVGVSQVALLASAHNVPVLVACETHKFCERVQSDSFVYNEMGEPDDIAQLLSGEDGPLSDWRTIPSLSLLNLSYDVTPPELVTAVATELAVLPCTSVPVVLRVRPAEPITSRH